MSAVPPIAPILRSQRPPAAPGSIVSIMNNGVFFERKGPHLLPFNGTNMLVYSYDTGGRGAGMVPHDQVQATGHEWSLSYWNPITKEMRPVDEEGAF
jgi:DEAD/DEAH box helicase domain-containing protein